MVKNTPIDYFIVVECITLQRFRVGSWNMSHDVHLVSGLLGIKKLVNKPSESAIRVCLVDVEPAELGKVLWRAEQTYKLILSP